MVTELNLGPMGYGAMGLTAFYGPAVPNAHGVDVMRAAYDAGCRLFDTAEIYQQFGEQVPGTYRYNEELIGEFIKTFEGKKEGEGRETVVVATKFMPKREYSFEMLEKACDDSLARLGIDTIDIYYMHRMYSEDVVTIETIAADMKKLVDKGKIRGYGLSEAAPETIRRAHAVHPVAAIQQEWSLFARDLEEEIVPTCKELGIAIVAYSPIARGMLSGALTEPPSDWRKDIPYLTAENMEANKKLIEAIESLAKEKGSTSAQICLAWVIKKGGVPIPGTTKIGRAVSNFAAKDVTLTEEDMHKLEALGSQVKGLRGSESYMDSTFHSQVKK
jgi:aryl-alcohol dehydrogenase-like predicted oxidoreductase